MGEKVDRLAARMAVVDKIGLDVEGEVERLAGDWEWSSSKWPVAGARRYKVSSYVDEGGRVRSNRPRKRKKRKKR